VWSARYPFVMAVGPRTRYAQCGDVELAYQVFGDGPIDLLLYSGSNIPIECMDEEPSMARFQRRLASFARVIRFDKRGMGMSDRGSPSNPPVLEDWVNDGVGVLDAVGSERAVVLAPWIDAPAGLALAATHPERVSRLIVVNGSARLSWAPDYPIGLRQFPAGAAGMELSADPDALERGFDLLAFVAPTVASDPAFRGWWDRAGNLGETPAMARARLSRTLRGDDDVRDHLSVIQCPALVLHRADLPVFSVEHGRYLAEHIHGARYVELTGVDYVYWVGDTGPMLDEIEEFLTGVRGGSGAERVLATVLFTDIAGSTDRAAQLGDQRWRDLLDRHDQNVRTQIERFRGREINTTGDGFLATFESPGRAIECAIAIRHTLGISDINVRAGIHTGEIEVRGGDVAGLAVHIGARVSALARQGEILVSSTVKDLVVGSNIAFTERGEHELKGVPGTWRLYAVHT
jgi:class 3 adenylate cyclase/pimeloyl-ACP methyl ester carboxylesterase